MARIEQPQFDNIRNSLPNTRFAHRRNPDDTVDENVVYATQTLSLGSPSSPNYLGAFIQLEGEIDPTYQYSSNVQDKPGYYSVEFVEVWLESDPNDAEKHPVLKSEREVLYNSADISTPRNAMNSGIKEFVRRKEILKEFRGEMHQLHLLTAQSEDQPPGDKGTPST